MAWNHQPFWLRRLPNPVVLGIATLGPVGHWKAPGTWGSVAGVLAYSVFLHHAHPLVVAALALAGLYLAVLICGEAERRLSKIDPGEVILDEFAAIPVCFIGLAPFLQTERAWMVYLGGFCLFRIFDIAKPFGIASLQRFHGGLGVVADDVAAALATCLTLHAVLWSSVVFGWW